MIDNFKNKIKQGYKDDDNWASIIAILEKVDNDADNIVEGSDNNNNKMTLPGIPFCLRNDLVHYISSEGVFRLYILSAIELEVFE